MGISILILVAGELLAVDRPIFTIGVSLWLIRSFLKQHSQLNTFQIEK